MNGTVQMAFGLGLLPAHSSRRRLSVPAIRPRIVAHGGHECHSGCGHSDRSRETSVRTALGSGSLLAASAGMKLANLGGPLGYALPLAGSVVVAGIPALEDAWNSIKKRDIGVDVMMTAAAGAAIATGAPFEGALLLCLFALSHAAEAAVTAHARAHLDMLEDLAPDHALLLQDDDDVDPAKAKTVPASKLKPGDRVLVRHNDVLPADALMEADFGHWSLAHLTGEATPQLFTGDQLIPAGAILMPPSSSLVTLRVQKVQAESSLSRINSLVHHASSSRSELHSSLLATFGKVYANAILLSCVVISLVPTPSMAALQRGLAFLIAGSPCALVVGAPVAYVAALTAAVRRGVLIKHGPTTMEKLTTMTQIAFDKTGTLTTGKLKLDKVLIYPGAESHSSADVPLSIAAAMEYSSPSHPVADAILHAAKEKGVAQKALHGVVKPVPGQGLAAETDGISMGRVAWVQQQVGSESERAHWLHETANSIQQKGSPLTSLAYNDNEAAIFVFADMVRPEAHSVMTKLRKRPFSLELSILTGDRASSAAGVANVLGFEANAVRANCTPEEKLYAIKQAGPGLIMVGDGINDGPALAAASSSVSMGLENATAVQASEIVLTRSNLEDLYWLLAKARSARNIAWQNVILGLTFMILTATPALMGLLPLWAAVLLHEGGTILVGLNGLRLLSDRLS